MNSIERMKSGKIYFCNDPELAKKQMECLEILYDYNHTRPSESEKRSMILKTLLAEVGENCYVEPPLHANWGCNTHFGNNVYANFNLTLVDDVDKELKKVECIVLDLISTGYDMVYIVESQKEMHDKYKEMAKED